MSAESSTQCLKCGEFYDTYNFKYCPACDERDYTNAILNIREKLKSKEKLEEDKIAAEIKKVIQNLQKDFNKYNLAEMLHYCQSGNLSCRAAADIILTSASYDRLRTSI